MDRRRRRQGWGSAVLVAVTVLGLLATAAPAAADEPTFIGWSDLLPGFTTGYEPTSENDCKKGHVNCVDQVIREMDRRYQPLLAACDHQAMFSLTYLRTTEEYRRTVEDPTFFSDTAFVNHQDAVFARYYFEAWDAYRAGDLASTPRAWQLAFDAADRRKVSGTGNLLLGMSAHVNRDLPYVLAAIGLVEPDGTSRKADHDKVNQFLNRVIEPLMAEAADVLDPSVDDMSVDGTTLDETATLQLLVAWRELAWRNAERLVRASTPAQRAAVEASIERAAALEAHFLISTFAYQPLTASAALAAAADLNAGSGVLGLFQYLARRADALAGRSHNLLHGLTGSGAATRDAYCLAGR